MYPNQWAHRGPMVFFNIIANRQRDSFRTMIIHNFFFVELHHRYEFSIEKIKKKRDKFIHQYLFFFWCFRQSN